MEEWRDVPVWEGYYEASTLGNIRRTKNKRLLKPGTDGRYCIAFLCKNGKREHFKWHRIIANTFPELVQNEWFPGAEIDHISGVKTDNSVFNLRWVNHKENMANENTKPKIKEFKTKPTGKPKTTIMSKNGIELCYFFTVRGAAEEMNIERSSIIRCCYGKSKTAGDYEWKYAE